MNTTLHNELEDMLGRRVNPAVLFPERYTVGEKELLRMLDSQTLDEGRVWTAKVMDSLEKSDHEIRDVKATRPYGPDWYEAQTFDLDAWLAGDVFAYGFNDPLTYLEIANDEVNEDTHVDMDTHEWLLGKEVA